MITIHIPRRQQRMFTRESAADFSRMAARFESAVMFQHGSRTINGKSLLGLLSFGDVAADVLVSIDGADEVAAERDVRAFFESGIWGQGLGVRD